VRLDAMETDASATLTIREAEKLETLNCEVIISILDWLEIILNAEARDASSIFLHRRISKLIEPMLKEDLWRMICILVFEPELLGFSLKNNNLHKKLQQKLKKCLELLPNKLRVSATNTLISNLNNYITEHQQNLQYLDSINQDTLKCGMKHRMLSFVQGCLLLLETDFWKLLDSVLFNV